MSRWPGDDGNNSETLQTITNTVRMDAILPQGLGNTGVM